MAKKKGRYAAASPPKTSSTRRVLSVLKNIFVWLMAIAAIAMMIFTVVSVTTFDQNDRSLFGYQAFIVKSDSMKATDFAAGDLILTRKVDPTTLVEGDIIAYVSTADESFGEIITHKIRTVVLDENGPIGFITYGTTSGINDTKIVPLDSVIGKYEITLSFVGHFFAFLKTTPGYVCCILIPFMILIGMNGANTFQLWKQYRQEQAQTLQAEREQIAAEKEEAQRLLAELARMRAQMGMEPLSASGETGDETAVFHTMDRQQGSCLPDNKNIGGNSNDQD